MLIGAGNGGTSLLRVFLDTSSVEVVAVIDCNPDSPGRRLADQYGIPHFDHWYDAIEKTVDVIFNVTGDESLLKEVRANLGDREVALIPGAVASVMFQLIEEKEMLIDQLKNQYNEQELIFHATSDGMLAIDHEHKITVLNRAAEQMTGLNRYEDVGKPIEEVLPTSQLPRVLQTEEREKNQRQVLNEDRSIITTRIPMKQNGKVVGALAVFKDVTEIELMAEEVTNLKSIRTMLEAIIQSSDDAISVVDENGIGLMINRAYTRLTGLSERDVIGHPATTDISEGESMHLRVLKTKEPVRGVKMKVGPNKKEVIVNVAPVIVDGQLKGSVGVVHDMSEMKTLSTELEKARQIIRTLEAKYTFEDIIGHSTEMRVSIEQAKVAATTPVTILLRGESGTGKELFAHAIHNASDRKYNKFIRVNCSALSESLLESELFGYEEGAFSGAKRGGKRGLFEEADKGSIFLDEIGELSPKMQAKLLRVLQEQEIVRVGGTDQIDIDVRVIAATNVHLEKEMQNEAFREDLYYRVNRMPIHIPALRDRKEDLADLCQHLLRKINQDFGRNVEYVTEEALHILRNYHWPGNVRELENVLGRAIIHMPLSATAIEVYHIPQLSMPEDSSREQVMQDIDQERNIPLAEQLETVEKEILRSTLEKHRGNKTQSAKHLGVSVRNLYYKLKKYHLE